jgi:drug/metabolite transporter (DMT)-like permease
MVRGMTDAALPPSPEPPHTTGARRTRLAALAILVYATIIGFTDNFVRVIAEDAGLWQFHATRSFFAAVLLAVLAFPLGLRLRPRNWGAVIRRSMIHGTAMVFYFGSLAFLPVAVVAAGLFTAPIFVLLISAAVHGERIGPYRIAAVAIGFVGVLLVLGLGSGDRIGPATVLPVLSGALYALGNIATRRWCEGESPETLTAGFFAALGAIGLVGLAVLAVIHPDAPAGTYGFVLRGAVHPTGTFLFWTFVQAAGSVLGVGLMIKAYQMAEASRVAVFEYVILPASAIWTWLLWGEALGAQAVAGMALIVAAGLIILARAR